MILPGSRESSANRDTKFGQDTQRPVNSNAIAQAGNVIIATIDSEIRNCLTEILQTSRLNAIWVKTVEEVKSRLTLGNIVGCLCGFWLADGTYRDIVRCVKRRPTQVPLGILCPPTCSQEQQELLAALNIGTLGFICYPYQGQDLERIFFANVQSNASEIRVPPPSEDSTDNVFASPGLRRAS